MNHTRQPPPSAVPTPLFALDVEDADLDQTVGIQAGVGLLHDGGCETITTDHDDGVKVMGFGAMNLALGGGKLYLRHGRIIEVV